MDGNLRDQGSRQGTPSEGLTNKTKSFSDVESLVHACSIERLLLDFSKYKELLGIHFFEHPEVNIMIIIFNKK